MKLRTLIVLLLALAFLGGLAYMNQQKEAAHEAAVVPSEETLLSLSNLNDIARFTVTVGKDSTTVTRVDDRWVVANLWNYPADFSRVSENLRKLADVKCGDIIRGGTDSLLEFGLDEAPTNSQGVMPPAVMKLYRADGSVMRKLSLGSPRMPKPTDGRPGFPESTYMRLDDGPVRLIAAYFQAFPRSSVTWLERSMVSVPSTDIAEISVTKTNGESYRVIRKDDGTFAADNLKPGETGKAQGANVVAGAVAKLFLNDIGDPALKPDVTGLDKPNVYAVTTRDGLVYTIGIGLPAGLSYGRYVKVGVTYQKPPAPPSAPKPSATDTNAPAIDPVKAWEAKTAADEKLAKSEDDRLSKWTFVVLEGICQNLTLPREQLVEGAPTNAASPVAATTDAPAR